MSNAMSEAAAGGVPAAGVKLGERRRRLMSEAVQIEEELVPAFVRPLPAVVAVLVLLFLAWATLANLVAVARASGEIIPSGQNKVVQHLDGGVEAEIATGEKSLLAYLLKPLADVKARAFSER